MLHQLPEKVFGPVRRRNSHPSLATDIPETRKQLTADTKCCRALPAFSLKSPPTFPTTGRWPSPPVAYRRHTDGTGAPSFHKAQNLDVDCRVLEGRSAFANTRHTHQGCHGLASISSAQLFVLGLSLASRHCPSCQYLYGPQSPTSSLGRATAVATIAPRAASASAVSTAFVYRIVFSNVRVRTMPGI